MHAYLSARHFSLTERIRDYVQRRLFDAIEQHADAHDLNRVEVQLSMSNGQGHDRFACHVMVQLPGQREVNITEHHQDLFATIDLAEKRVVPALVALRQRRQTMRRHPRPPRATA